MTLRCWPKTLYTIPLKKWKDFGDGGGTDFMNTSCIGLARFMAKKLPLKYRQIDVRIKGKKPYVLEGSWK